MGFDKASFCQMWDYVCSHIKTCRKCRMISYNMQANLFEEAALACFVGEFRDLQAQNLCFKFSVKCITELWLKCWCDLRDVLGQRRGMCAFNLSCLWHERVHEGLIPFTIFTLLTFRWYVSTSHLCVYFNYPDGVLCVQSHTITILLKLGGDA